MRTPYWIKRLSGHAGELYVAAELSKRGIPNALLPENFSDDDILLGRKDEGQLAYIQVKSCHPDRGNNFELGGEECEGWLKSLDNRFVVFVWLGSPKKKDSPIYWIASKRDVGAKYMVARDPKNKRCRLAPDEESGLSPRWKYTHARLDKSWQGNWGLFDAYLPSL